MTDLTIKLQQKCDNGLRAEFHSQSLNRAVGDAYVYYQYDDLVKEQERIHQLLDRACVPDEYPDIPGRLEARVMYALIRGNLLATEREAWEAERRRADELIPAVYAGLAALRATIPHPDDEQLDNEHARWCEEVDYQNTLAEFTGRD